MKWAEILRNLGDYKSEGLTVIDRDTKKFRTDIHLDPALIMGFSCGYNIQQGSYNHKLSIATREATQFFKEDTHIPIILQREIFNIFPKYRKEPVFETGDYNHANTHDVIEEAGDIANKKGIDTTQTLFVAHPAHIFRILELGKNVRPKIFTGAPFLEEKVTWNIKDTQRRTQGAIYQIPFEILARAHHKLHRWI